MWLFKLFLEIFILTPLNWIIHKNYAIYDFHPINFFRDIDKALKIRWLKKLTARFNLSSKYILWILHVCKVFILGQCTCKLFVKQTKIYRCHLKLRLSRIRSNDPKLGLLHNKEAYILATRELIRLHCKTYARVLGFMKKTLGKPSSRFCIPVAGQYQNE